MENIYVDNIEDLTIKGDDYRKVLFTTPDNNLQLTIMSIKPNADVGMEMHETVDQFIRIEQGVGYVQINDEKKDIKDGFAIIIPAGTEHNIVNTGSNDLKLYSIYTPKNHPLHAIEHDKPLEDQSGGGDYYKKKYYKYKKKYKQLKLIN